MNGRRGNSVQYLLVNTLAPKTISMSMVHVTEPYLPVMPAGNYVLVSLGISFMLPMLL